MSDVMALTQGISIFTNFLPPLSEVRRNDPSVNPEFAADVRVGEMAAVGLTVGIGAVSAALSKSNTPIVIALVTAVGLILIYESTLRADRPGEKASSSATLAVVPTNMMEE